jgi:hypothetical protein
VIWVGWRLQRTETLVAAAILVLLALLLVPTGIDMTHAFDHDGLSACLGLNTTPSCGVAVQAFASRFSGFANLIGWFTLVPGLLGVMLAAPLVLELESGTYRLAWTQSITRRRWLVTKLGVAIGTALLAALVLTLLVTWWRAPYVRLFGRMGNGAFDSEGTVAFAYTLFALGLAAALGAVWRRAVPALLVAFACYVPLRIFVDTWLRQRLVAPASMTWSVTGPVPASLNRAWAVTEFPSDRIGHPAQVAIGTCLHGALKHSRFVTPKCLAQHGAGYIHAIFQPASHFWPLQGIETAMFGGTALVLIAFAAWWTHERAA